MRIALTFDDGPNPRSTPDLLDVLTCHQAQATFFMIGHSVEAFPELVRSVARAGHVVANHGYGHDELTRLSEEGIRRTVLNGHRALTKVLGEHSRLFRPPFGNTNPLVEKVIAECGCGQVFWQVNADDWNPHTPKEIFQMITNSIEHEGFGFNLPAESRILSDERSVCVLLHDGPAHSDRSASVIAADLILQHYKGRADFITL